MNKVAAVDIPESTGERDEYEGIGDVLAVTRNGRAKVTENNSGHG